MSRVLRFAALAALSLVLLLVVAGISLTVRGRAEMGKSDVAFHDGRLREALVHARQAALAYVPGAEHVHDAYARIEAIAVGAESSSDRVLAKIAWDTLRLVHVQTDYPGRPPSDIEGRAKAGLARLQKLEPVP